MPPGGSMQQAPPLPSATTYTPVMTPGTQTYTPPPPAYAPQMNASGVKNVLRSILNYVAIFLGVTIVSVTQLQSMVLRFIPSAYTSSGVVSLYGAAFLGAVGVVVIYILQTLMQPLI